MGLTATWAVAYAGLLLATAAALEWTARRVHRRAERMQTAGFTFERAHDRWRCPTGNLLHRRAADHHRVRVVYRAEPQVCGACALKRGCTDSEQGRTLEVAPDAWVGSTMERFHRGLSLALMLLAELILIAAYWARPDAMLLAFASALAAVGFRVAQRFFRVVLNLDDSVPFVPR